MTSKWKNKTTLFSSTFKVWYNNMPLFFHFEVIWRSYAPFLVLSFSTLWAQIVKSSCARAGSSLWPSELKLFVVISIDHGNEKNCLANFSSIFFTFWTPLLVSYIPGDMSINYVNIRTISGPCMDHIKANFGLFMQYLWFY